MKRVENVTGDSQDDEQREEIGYGVLYDYVDRVIGEVAFAILERQVDD